MTDDGDVDDRVRKDSVSRERPRFGGGAVGLVRDGEVVVRIGERRLGTDRPAKPVHGLVKPLRAQRNDAGQVQRVGVGGPAATSLAFSTLNGSGGFARSSRHDAHGQLTDTWDDALDQAAQEAHADAAPDLGGADGIRSADRRRRDA